MCVRNCQLFSGRELACLHNTQPEIVPDTSQVTILLSRSARKEVAVSGNNNLEIGREEEESVRLLSARHSPHVFSTAALLTKSVTLSSSSSPPILLTSLPQSPCCFL